MEVAPVEELLEDTPFTLEEEVVAPIIEELEEAALTLEVTVAPVEDDDTDDPA